MQRMADQHVRSERNYIGVSPGVFVSCITREPLSRDLIMQVGFRRRPNLWLPRSVTWSEPAGFGHRPSLIGGASWHAVKLVKTSAQCTILLRYCQYRCRLTTS